MKVAVTGASGFIGHSLCAELTGRGHVVTATVRDQVELEADRTVLVGDLTGDVDWGGAVKHCDAVIHLAGRAHVTTNVHADALASYRRVNRDATLALARQANAAGVRRFVYVSSILVHGDASERPFRASDTPAPLEPYAISKYEAELALRELAARSSMELVIVRPPLAYGPHVRANFLRLMKLAASGYPLPFASAPGVRSFVSIWNLSDLLVRCVEHPAAAGHVLLASDGEDVALPDLIRMLAGAMGRPTRLFSVPPAVLRTIAGGIGGRSMRDKLFATLRVDDAETRRLLGWFPPVRLAEGLTRTAQWYAQTHLAAAPTRGDRETSRAPVALSGNKSWVGSVSPQETRRSTVRREL